MSTQATLPRRIASTVWPTVSQPMSLAKWLNVPPGNTASGDPGLQRDGGCARHRAVAAADSEHLRPVGRLAQLLLDVVVITDLDDLGPRQAPRGLRR